MKKLHSYNKNKSVLGYTFFAFVFFLFFSNNHTFAQPGVLDVTFGNKGKIMTAVSDSGSEATAVALQSDGKIVAVGRSTKNFKDAFTVVRYNTDGTLDNTFGNGGIITTDVGSLDDIAKAVVIQPDGKILVAGSMGKPYSSTYGNDNDFALVRYNTNGFLDSSFGKNGISTTDFENADDQAYSLVITTTGKILLAGGVQTAIGGFNFGLAQYNSNGSLDSTFGNNGKVFTDIDANSGDAARCMILLSDGKILAGGNANMVGSESDFAVVRYLPNGAIDSSFGVNGKVLTDFSNSDDYGLSISKYSDGRFVLAGQQFKQSGNVNLALARYQTTGAPDSTFGSNGKVITTYNNLESAVSSVHVMPDGKILATGVTGTLDSSGDVRLTNFALFRYNINGSLDNVFGKRGVVITDFKGFEDLSNSSIIQPDGKIVLVGNANKDLNYFYSSSSSTFGLARYLPNALLYYNTIQGSIFVDNNYNGIKDSVEQFFSNAKVVSIKQGVDTITEISNTGRFTLDVDTGSYKTTVVPFLPYYNVVPATYTTSHSGYFNTDSIAFALQPVAGKKDLVISLIPVTAARPGFEVQYRLAWRNEGTETIPGASIRLIKNSKLNYLSSSFAPTSQSADTLKWEFVEIKPLEAGSIFVNFRVTPPPAVNNGDTIGSTATIFPVSGDVTPGNNISALSQRVVGSYDPNDKTESHGGVIKQEHITNGEYLNYTIRFQNTGTDTAFNVVIKDTLTNKLDWSTLQMVTASHSYQLYITDDNKCTWYFDNILLPDSNTNERASHGYLVFKIKPKNTVSVGDTIKNTAGIYFDYNLPVQTNTERTAIQSTVLPVKLLTFTAKRNGKDNLVEWTTSQQINFSHFEVERSTDGRDFTTIGKLSASNSSKYHLTDDRPVKGINYYRLKMIDKEGKFEYSAIRSLNNQGSFEASIYPNPAKENLSLKIESEKIVDTQLEIITLDGKVLMSKQLTVQTGTTISHTNISALSSGSYFLRIKALGKEQVALKFEKL